MAMHDIKNIRLLSLETALNLFKTRIIPILCYGIEVIWSHLTENNLNTLEKVKATYLKRIFGVSKTTRSRLVYLLAREPFLLEDIKLRYMLQHTRALGNQMKTMEEKRADVWPEFYDTGAMTDRTWTTSNCGTSWLDCLSTVSIIYYVPTRHITTQPQHACVNCVVKSVNATI